jgi:hypothetical protein
MAASGVLPGDLQRAHKRPNRQEERQSGDLGTQDQGNIGGGIVGT